MSDYLWPHGLPYTRLSCPSLSPWVCSNSCPFSRWCHPTISSSVAPFSSCLQSFPVSDSLKFRGQESTLKEEELWFWTWLGQDAKLCEGLPDSWKCRFQRQENRGVWIYREPVTTLGIAWWSKRWCLKRGKPRVELWKFLHSRLILLGFSKDGQRSRTVNNYIMKVEEESL